MESQVFNLIFMTITELWEFFLVSLNSNFKFHDVQISNFNFKKIYIIWALRPVHIQVWIHNLFRFQMNLPKIIKLAYINQSFEHSNQPSFHPLLDLIPNQLFLSSGLNFSFFQIKTQNLQKLWQTIRDNRFW